MMRELYAFRFLHVRFLSTSRTNSKGVSSSRVDTDTSDGKRKARYDAWFNERAEKDKGISLKEKTLTIQVLAEKFQKGSLNLTPDYQRGFVWKENRSARLIETVIGGRFIPPVVLHEKKTGRMDVIDGKQRLSTLLSFFLGPIQGLSRGLPPTAAILQPERLDDGEEHPLKGLRFEDLPEHERNRFLDFGVDVKIVPRDADEDLVFDIYEDINSGADDLTAHQLRRAAYSGAFMRLVDRLRGNADFLTIRGADAVDHIKEADGEMVLRAFAFSNNKREYKAPLKKFLNREASSMNRRLTDDAGPSGLEDDAHPLLLQLEQDFKKVTAIMVEVFGPDKVCREWKGGRWASHPSLWLWDGLFVCLKEAVCDDREVTPVGLQRRAGAIVSALQAKFESGAFAQARDMTRPHMARRRDLLRQIIIHSGEAAGPSLVDGGNGVASLPATADSRHFARDPAWLRGLWEQQGGRCALCGEDIHADAVLDGGRTHVDHTVPHAAGGRTVPENAQLVHARCNQSKGARP